MIAILVGTRPELIKMAPVLRKLDSRKISHIFIHSGQHYSKEMDQQVIEDLQLEEPDYNLHVGSGSHAVQTGKIMEEVEKICLERKPDVMVVHGDTNTTLAGALTAKKLQISVAHVEAGLRSFDYKMPEEINRILTDRISDILFAPTKDAKQNLLKEGINEKTILITGNTVVDALQDHLALAKNSTVLKDLGLTADEYILVTAHRPENVDDHETLKKLVEIIKCVGVKMSKKILWPVHPRTKKQLEVFKIVVPESIILISPVGYIDMLALLDGTAMVLTDSGGVQEEAYILKKPLITLRDSTERPETLTANFIVHLDKKKIDDALIAYATGKVSWTNAFGNGDASEKIISSLLSYIKKVK